MSGDVMAQSLIGGTLLYDEPMSKHTSWRVGGPADRFYKPANRDDLEQFIARLPANEFVYWLGLGSNLLVRDGGIRGTVIKTAGLLTEMSPIAANDICVESGVACAKVARFAAHTNLSGAEFLAGIPGTMGGALAMNAGAFGRETWDIVRTVDMINRQGQVITKLASEFAVGYRSVPVPQDEWFVASQLHLSKGDKTVSLSTIKQLLRNRADLQPLQLPSCGSVFRNPVNDYAARLIEQSDLKGKCIGGACVAQKHANFIINNGTASAMDIEQLITEVAQIVAQRHGVQLQCEVCIVGERLTGDE